MAVAAARIAPCAISTDTSGSVRIPAGWCGLCRAQDHHRPDQRLRRAARCRRPGPPGPITRSVEDAATLLCFLRGADRRDPHTQGVTDKAIHNSHLRRGVAGLRLARLPASERAGVDAEMLADVIDSNAASWRASGSRDRRASTFLDLWRRWRRRTAGSSPAESYAALTPIVDDPHQPLDEAVRRQVPTGAAISSRAYPARTWPGASSTRDLVAEAMRDIDALLTPTTETAIRRRWATSIRPRARAP